MRKRNLLIVALLAAACARPENTLYPTTDRQGNPVQPDPNSCLASVAARRYVYEMRERVLAVWEPPASRRGKASFTVFLRIDESGGLKQVYTEEPEDPVRASAIAAFQQAAPFPPVPSEAACLAEEPFEAHFAMEAQ